MVSRLFELMFEGSFTGVPRMYQGSFKGVFRKIKGCSESPLGVIQGSFEVSKRRSKGVSRQFQSLFMEVLGVSSVF